MDKTDHYAPKPKHTGEHMAPLQKHIEEGQQWLEAGEKLERKAEQEEMPDQGQNKARTAQGWLWGTVCQLSLSPPLLAVPGTAGHHFLSPTL